MGTSIHSIGDVHVCVHNIFKYMSIPLHIGVDMNVQECIRIQACVKSQVQAIYMHVHVCTL